MLTIREYDVIWDLLLHLKVKRYVRKGIPNEHRGTIWMLSSGAQEQLQSHPGFYHSLLAMEHDPKLEEVIHIGQRPSQCNTFVLLEFTLSGPIVLRNSIIYLYY